MQHINAWTEPEFEITRQPSLVRKLDLPQAQADVKGAERALHIARGWFEQCMDTAPNRFAKADDEAVEVWAEIAEHAIHTRLAEANVLTVEGILAVARQRLAHVESVLAQQED
jgi:hypothetical protein